MTTQNETTFVPSLFQRAEMALEDSKMVIDDIKKVAEVVDVVCKAWERCAQKRATIEDVRWELEKLVLVNNEILKARS